MSVIVERPCLSCGAHRAAELTAGSTEMIHRCGACGIEYRTSIGVDAQGRATFTLPAPSARMRAAVIKTPLCTNRKTLVLTMSPASDMKMALMELEKGEVATFTAVSPGPPTVSKPDEDLLRWYRIDDGPGRIGLRAAERANFENVKYRDTREGKEAEFIERLQRKVAAWDA